MTDEQELAISGALWDALPSDVKDSSDPNALKILVLAGFLELLSQDYGMSEEEQEALLERATRPHYFLPFLAHYFSSDETGADAPNRLRDVLYRGLVDIVETPLSAESGAAVLEIAQIFWALSHDKQDRPLLPLTGGQQIEVRDASGQPVAQQAWIAVGHDGTDFARLKRSVRANRAKGVAVTSGRGLLRKGCEVAVLVARALLHSVPGEPPSLVGASIRQVETPTIKRSIVWVNDSIPPDVELRPAREELRPVAEDEARDLLAVVDRLRFLSEALPEEHEGSLAAAALAAGFALARAGHAGRALEEFSRSASISETLSVLHPDEHSHSVRLVLALLMTASLRLLVGGPAADELFDRASSLSQDLNDRDDEHADLAATALTLQGLSNFQSGKLETARRLMVRAVAIAAKITRRAASDASAELLLANSFIALAAVDLTSGRHEEALSAVTQSLSISERLHASAQGDPAIRYLYVGSRQVAGMIFDELGRPLEAIAVTTDALNVVRSIVEDEPANQRARYLLAMTEVSLGRHNLSLRSYAAAIECMSNAIVQFERLAPRVGDGTGGAVPADADSIHIGALLVRGALLAQLGRTDDAEASLLRVVAMVDDGSHSESLPELLQSLEILASIYRESGRDAYATHAEYRVSQARESDGFSLGGDDSR